MRTTRSVTDSKVHPGVGDHEPARHNGVELQRRGFLQDPSCLHTERHLRHDRRNKQPGQGGGRLCSSHRDPVRRMVSTTNKRLVVASKVTGRIGDWANALSMKVSLSVVASKPLAQSIKAMDQFVNVRSRQRASGVDPIAPPPTPRSSSLRPDRYCTLRTPWRSSAVGVPVVSFAIWPRVIRHPRCARSNRAVRRQARRRAPPHELGASFVMSMRGNLWRAPTSYAKSPV